MMHQNLEKILGVVLVALFLMPLLVSVSHGQISVPIPKDKPDISSLEKEVFVGNILPRPITKPVLLPTSIQPNDKKLVVTPEGGVAVIHKDDPSPLDKISSDKQARLVREIFDLQNRGKIKQADDIIKKLKSDVLLGHILAERYLHPTYYDASFEELSEWIKNYDDHPQASKIYQLAKLKFSKQSNDLKRPKRQKQIAGNITVKSQRALNYKTTKRRNADQQRRVEKLYQEIKSKARKSQPSLALNILSNDYATQFMDDVEYDELRAIIAASYFYALKLDSAYRISSEAYRRSGKNVPLAGWVKGLIEWKRGEYSSAAQSFETAASSRYASGWLVSASAYWASRAHMRSGNSAKISQSLSLAAAHPRTFYGLIATRALGNENHFNWKIPSLSRDDIKNIESVEKGRRASLLIQANQKALAESELRSFPVYKNTDLKKSLLAYANHHKLPSILMLMGNALLTERGNYYDSALYPLSKWISAVDFKVDESLMNAFIRQESRFNQLASNPSGATGLMQLMPTTANHVVGEDLFGTPQGQYRLKAPDRNLDIGQRYIQELLQHPAVQNDVMHLAIAYNAGPGNLTKWKRERGHINDPLLFIETIPFNETRAFVERIMANYWVYRMQAGEPTPTLDAVASGQWAKYASN